MILNLYVVNIRVRVAGYFSLIVYEVSSDF